MTDSEVLALLNRAFVRVYRSYGQYVREAAPVFDVGQDTIESILDRQAADAERLGEYIVREQGNIYPGHYPTELGDFHFLNTSRLLGDWVDSQRELVAGLESDLSRLRDADGEGVEILREIEKHEREHLQRLIELQKIPAPVAT